MHQSETSEQFIRLWVAQLYKEHHEIAWYHRLPLKPVVIRIVELSSQWGQWDPFLRTITLSMRLMKEHSWDVVLEILKHEMAHQYVSECMPIFSQKPHGNAFKEACQKLGVSSWASKATGDIPTEIPTLRMRVLSQDDQRLLERVEKLLSLATSSNEHEALLAMEKVRELYAKHNLDRIKQSLFDDAMDSLYLTKNKKKTEPTEAKILAILNDHFRVKVIHTHLYNAAKCERYKAAEILGRRENILMAEFVYHFLSQQIENLWNAHKKESRCPGSLKRSYQMGVLSGFDEKLTGTGAVEAKVASRDGICAGDLRALQKVEQSHMADFVEMKYPRLSRKSWGGGQIDSVTFASGQSAGRSLNLNRPITSSGRFGGYLS
jgi:hypothetical protein